MAASLPRHSFLWSSSLNLDQFVASNIQQTDEFNRHCARATDELASYLKERSGLSVAEVVKGGSLGKGTAVLDHSDLDAVLIINGSPNVDSYKADLPIILRSLEQNLRSSRPCSGFNIAVLEVTKFTINLTMNEINGTGRLHVDVVPAFCLKAATEIFKEMEPRNSDDRSYYSSSLMKIQVGFVKTLPANVKNLIRLVKYWRKTHLRENMRGKPKIPKSYVLELVVIRAWEEAGQPQRFKMEQGFKSLLQSLVNFRRLDIFWTKYYSDNERIRYSHGIRVQGKPYILDPADPFHNVGADFDWDEIAEMAALSCYSPRLQAVQVSPSWN